VRAGALILILTGVLIAYWVIKHPEAKTTLPPSGGPGTPNTPVQAGVAGVGTNGQQSTLNGPAQGSQLANELFGTTAANTSAGQ
jgi:hypothetical protein